ncbi:MAG: EAL domain-containing protein, partial [Firmicutes bacterium]|nr:EAL domain-containing protein [Bacillota bacterium]
YKQLLDDRLIADVEAALLESGMGPGLLELEITENLLLTHFPHIISVMNRLKGMGVRVALDDFGSGSSTLAQLRQLPVDTLKIDRSIVGAIPENDTDAALIKAIADFGRALSLAVVAEGVETAEQQAFLRNTSCTLVQGFYFSRPLSPAGITELMSRTAHRSSD